MRFLFRDFIVNLEPHSHGRAAPTNILFWSKQYEFMPGCIVSFLREEFLWGGQFYDQRDVKKRTATLLLALPRSAIAVKAINHYGDEVMKVYNLDETKKWDSLSDEALKKFESNL